MKNKSVSNHDRFEKHSVMPIPFKAHKVKWLSAELIEENFENHYGAQVRLLNDLEKQHTCFDQSVNTPAEFATVRRTLLETASSIALHETYFNCIGDESEQQRSFNPLNQLGKSIELSFGSFEALLSEFSELSKNRYQTVDWILLVWSDQLGRLINIPIGENAMPVFGVKPILAINLQEYAFKKDFGKDRDKYVSAFLECIHWGRVSDRFNAVFQPDELTTLESTSDSITVNDLKQWSSENTNTPLVLDVRHTDDCERYRQRIDETEWRDSFNVQSWSSDLPKDKPIVVYCMYGFWVSQDVATELRAQGYDARSLIGGINSWRAMGYEASDF